MLNNQEEMIFHRMERNSVLLTHNLWCRKGKTLKKTSPTREVTLDGHPVARTRRKSDVLPPEAEHSRKSSPSTSHRFDTVERMIIFFSRHDASVERFSISRICEQYVRSMLGYAEKSGG